MAKTDRITVRLTAEDREWAERRADDMGLDVSDVVRMLIRQARKGIVEASGPQVDPEEERRRAEEEERKAAIQRKRAELLQQLAEIDGDLIADEPVVEEVEVPPDPDGGVASDELRSLLSQSRAVLRSASANGASGAYKFTQPAGVNTQVGVGSRMGDAHGNLVRQNFAHLGFRS